MPDSTKRELQQHVEIWRRAQAELAVVKERELQHLDTREAVAQLFGHNTLVQDAPRLTHSGLVEQQAWFAKVRKRS
jgi:hypothetical protein